MQHDYHPRAFKKGETHVNRFISRRPRQLISLASSTTLRRLHTKPNLLLLSRDVANPSLPAQTSDRHFIANVNIEKRERKIKLNRTQSVRLVGLVCVAGGKKGKSIEIRFSFSLAS